MSVETGSRPKCLGAFERFGLEHGPAASDGELTVLPETGSTLAKDYVRVRGCRARLHAPGSRWSLDAYGR
jgi:hypothetical protein